MELGYVTSPWVAGAIVAVAALALLLVVMHAGQPAHEDTEGDTPDEAALLTNRSFLKQMELYGRH
jgi:hypothetical protein